MMDDPVELWERPEAEEIYMIAGWRQWADAGSVSSALPPYLVEHLQARQIGRIRPHGFYLFQLPGMHELLRPHVKLEDGFLTEQKSPDNLIYYWGHERKGLVIFIGDEPHLNAEGYAEAFFKAARQLGVRRIASVGGVYAPVPFDKHREISCTYSLREMKDELDKYAVAFSNYEGGTSIGSYFHEEARRVGIEYFVFYAMVPYYDLSQLSSRLQGVGIEEDYRAWYDLMGRVNHMFDLGIDLSELRRRGDALVEAMETRVQELDTESPKAGIREFLEKVSEAFTEREFSPFSDVWESELGDLFRDEDTSI